ncbi:diacylglycerol kinase family protein, partial [Frankia sp. AiPs1]|uniref:diacylglycerol kinase family protein n=1 Tax=Frankia sp. AiPs1 TaxID=573493 RepID=UPI0035ABE623
MRAPAPPVPVSPMPSTPAAVEVDRRLLTVIVNPSAGRGRALRLLDGVRAELDRWSADVRVAPTRDLAHAGQLAAEATAQGRV